jgi:type IV conjugative transfer system protein TraL
MAQDSELEHRQIMRLDEAAKLFWFTQAQAAAFFGFFLLGGMANAILSGMAAGVLLAYLIGAESRTHRAFWKHVAYWYIPGRLGMKRMPDSAIRQLIR